MIGEGKEIRTDKYLILFVIQFLLFLKCPHSITENTSKINRSTHFLTLVRYIREKSRGEDAKGGQGLPLNQVIEKI